MKECSRCGRNTEQLYEHTFENDEGDKVKQNLCWDCDWEVTNGVGEWNDDVCDIMQYREERAYEDNPINNPKPFGWQ